MEGGFRVAGDPALAGTRARWRRRERHLFRPGLAADLHGGGRRPQVVDELLKGKTIGDRTYKVHLDGYNQTAAITGKGPSARHEIFYFGESTLGAIRIDDYKYRFIDQPKGWIGEKTHPDMPDPDQPAPGSVRADGVVGRRGREGVGAILGLVQVRVLALRVRAAGRWARRSRPSLIFRRCSPGRASISMP